MKNFILATAIASVLAIPAYAEGYYSGKTITYIIATSPGGGYDAYGRLIGQNLGEKLGASKVLFKNLPGAGHIIGANTLYAAKPDGLTIGTFNTGLIYAQILNQPGVQFDLNKFGWVGKASADARAIVLGTNSNLKSFDDLLNSKDKVLFAASGVGSANYTETKMLTSAMDLPVDMVPGYNGNEGEMAMMRGEVVGQVASYESLHQFVDAGNGIYVAAIGGTFEPQAINYATSEKGKALINLIDANSNLGRLTATPPGVEPAVLEELRDAYMAVLTDPDVLVRAAKMNLSIDPARGDKVVKMITAALDQSPETIAIIADALKAEAEMVQVTTEILALDDGGKEVTFSNDGVNVVGSVSGSRTQVSLNGAEASRKDLEVGMSCDLEYDPASDGNEFKSIACSNNGVAPVIEGGPVKLSTQILTLGDGGKLVTFKNQDTEVVGSVSGSRTAVTLNGAEATRKDLAVGMTCDMEYDPKSEGNEFKTLSCSN